MQFNIHTTFVSVNSLCPRKRAGFHHCIGHADGVQLVHYTLKKNKKRYYCYQNNNKRYRSKSTSPRKTNNNNAQVLKTFMQLVHLKLCFLIIRRFCSDLGHYFKSWIPKQFYSAHCTRLLKCQVLPQ